MLRNQEVSLLPCGQRAWIRLHLRVPAATDQSVIYLFPFPLPSCEGGKDPPEECLGAPIGLGSGAAAVPPFLHRRYRLSASSPVVLVAVMPRLGFPFLWRPEVKHVVHVGHKRAAEELWLVATADLARHPSNKVYRRIDGDLSPFQTGASDTLYKPYELRKMFQRFQEKVQSWSDLVWRGTPSCVEKRGRRLRRGFLNPNSALSYVRRSYGIQHEKTFNSCCSIPPPRSISLLNFQTQWAVWGEGKGQGVN